MTSIQHPYRAMLTSIQTTRTHAEAAVHMVSLPPSALPIVDPRIPAIASARQAIAELDKGIALDGQVPAGAIDAARRARSELLQGMITLDDGHPSIVPARQHFQSSVIWLNVAEGFVKVQPTRPHLGPPTTMPIEHV